MPGTPPPRPSPLTRPCKPARSELDSINLATGSRAAIDVIRITRPQRRARIPGSAVRMAPTLLIHKSSKAARHAASDRSAKSPGGGPPVFTTRTSSCPMRFSVSRTRAAAAPGADRSETIPSTPSWTAVAARRSALRAQIATRAPSATSACAMALPSPREPPITSARRPSNPRFTSTPQVGVGAGQPVLPRWAEYVHIEGVLERQSTVRHVRRNDEHLARAHGQLALVIRTKPELQRALEYVG